MAADYRLHAESTSQLHQQGPKSSRSNPFSPSCTIGSQTQLMAIIPTPPHIFNPQSASNSF
ncbi:hypothetical protein EYF80_021046 [Liparis tanakae]|uniref:Uncharacterized protein n=1 Tax=Liparis tanakae TaxID=230148 RepID=A0A4Z2HUP6_9TELE|nr:hypothetical protein EYF80_021046 [Liparis tanakae]